MDIQEILRGYKAGEISLEIAEAKIRQIDERPGKGYTNMGSPDWTPSGKSGRVFPEVIFCSGKPDDYLVAIYRKITELEGRAFGTRATPHQAALVQEAIPAAEYDPVSRILKVERSGGASVNTGASGSCDTSDVSGATGVHGVSGVGTVSGGRVAVALAAQRISRWPRRRRRRRNSLAPEWTVLRCGGQRHPPAVQQHG